MTCKKLSDKDERKKRRVFGRRQNRPLRKSQKEAFEALMPVLSVPDDLLKEDGQLTPQDLFEKPFDEYRMEIGFGSGEHLTALLNQYPDIGFLGAEPFINGMASFLRDIHLKKPIPKKTTPSSQPPTPSSRRRPGASHLLSQDPGLRRDDGVSGNIRVLMDDAMLLAHSLADGTLDKIYILNPDPWHKKRHNKRRIVNQENLNHFSRILKPGGELVMATDVDDLAEWMVTQCMTHPDFEWSANSAKDWKTPPAEWIETRYAHKGRTAGRNQSFLIFRKR